MYSLDQLRGFTAVAEELHFGRAAARLNMTQPPLSRQIQKLEKAIGVQLFDRDNRGVALTAAGKAFLADARKLLELADAAPSLARRISAGSAGSVRIGFTAASTFGLLGALLNEISGALPDVDVDLKEMVTRDQTAALISGEIDLGLARPPFDEELFDSRLLYREPIMVAVPAGHRLTRLGREVTAKDLEGEDLIMHSPTEARYFYDIVISLVSSHRTFVHTVSQILTMIFLVAAGRGLALVPHSATVLGIEGVDYVELGGFEKDPVELHAIWMRGSRNPALHRVLDIITEAID
ncbi:LysR family transcriptional regulator [Arthrobacter sp. ISL-72]|uniref:LysR family transcriptional regulator n=1 Tax=Arthrobacter sp. ISL-72 TaxID=2819114 RepID=UPI001BE98E37|nr:LysR family transcriptional regulator [Arthrobacter sp. ISL-72]MBT2597256.1 LysR family transcriptional regulator [Arthrobacter sp. ISL-72]